MREVYPATVRTIPSLWHFVQTMNRMLTDTDGYHVGRGKDRSPREELADHLNVISRDWLVRVGAPGWEQWWDDFAKLTDDAGASVAPLLSRRKLYFEPIRAALPLLTAAPHLPASNAAIEVKVRNLLKPVLRGRSQRYRNLARTNGLLDLLVCRDQGVLRDRALLTHLLREDNLAPGNDGWSTPLRTWDDRQPPTELAATADALITGPDDPTPPQDDQPRRRRSRPAGTSYASLLDPGLVPALLDERLFADTSAQQPAPAAGTLVGATRTARS